METEDSAYFSRGAKFYLLFFLASMFIPSSGEIDFLRVVWSVVLLHVIGGGSAILFAKKGYKGSFAELLQIKWPEPDFWKDCLKGTGKLYLSLIASMIIVVPIFKALKFNTDGHAIAVVVEKLNSPWQWLLLLIFVGIVGPFVEEVIFRRFFFQSMLSRLGKRYAYFVTCALFSLIHFVPVGFLSYYLIAFILQRSMEKRENLLYPYVMHAMYNSIQVLLMFIYMRK